MATKRMPEDLTGRRYGRLTVVAFATRKRGYRLWHCLCDCGKRSTVYEHGLKSGHTASCGCLRLERLRAKVRIHGEARDDRRTVEYTTWAHMKNRCANDPGYIARGITVCEEWNDFSRFLADMGRRPSPRHSIERVDNDKRYHKDNCIWATMQTQINNRSTTIFVVLNGERLPLSEACRKAGIKYDCVKGRRDRGWPEERWFEPTGWHWRHSLVSKA